MFAHLALSSRMVAGLARGPVPRMCIRPHLHSTRMLSTGAKNDGEKQPEGEKGAEEASSTKAQQSQEAGTPTHKGAVRAGPLSWPALGLAMVVGGLTVYYFSVKLDEKKEKSNSGKKLPAVGKPLLGGPFDLIDTSGKTVTDSDFRGKFMLIYFGFTHCPDVCPDELNKISAVYTKLESNEEYRGRLVPVFITIDPYRDTKELIREYLDEFHPAFVGLTGPEEKIAEVCKAYRVYYSKGPVDVDEDYLVDHTIISYLVDPQGQFQEFYTKSCDAQEMLNRVVEQMSKSE